MLVSIFPYSKLYHEEHYFIKLFPFLFFLTFGLHKRNSHVTITLWNVCICTLVNGNVHFMAFYLALVLVPNALQIEGVEESFVFLLMRVFYVSTCVGR